MTDGVSFTGHRRSRCAAPVLGRAKKKSPGAGLSGEEGGAQNVMVRVFGEL